METNLSIGHCFILLESPSTTSYGAALDWSVWLVPSPEATRKDVDMYLGQVILTYGLWMPRDFQCLNIQVIQVCEHMVWQEEGGHVFSKFKKKKDFW